MLPVATGIVIGKVKQRTNDPLNENRILIELPLPDGSTKELWARVATLYATQGAGSFFLPETGDEVVVGFFNQDLNYPVILGSLISTTQTLPYTYTEQNQKKAIVTHEKLKIEFDEEKKVISIQTPGNNQIVVSDEGKSIQLSDQNGNKLNLDSNGITISSSKDILLKSNGSVIIEAASNVNIGSKSDLVLNGVNVKATAQVGFTAKGNGRIVGFRNDYSQRCNDHDQLKNLEYATSSKINRHAYLPDADPWPSSDSTCWRTCYRTRCAKGTNRRVACRMCRRHLRLCRPT
jgi:uncharacterized protein involved in type VI secretion and phage assembly